LSEIPRGPVVWAEARPVAEIVAKRTTAEIFIVDLSRKTGLNGEAVLRPPLSVDL
jgi:hypothetical protein